MVSADTLKDLGAGTSSPLQEARLAYQPQLPRILEDLAKVKGDSQTVPPVDPAVAKLFPANSNKPILNFIQGPLNQNKLPLRIGVVFSGGQAPGGHNVITGLFDALKKRNPASRLYGFKGGPSGILRKEYIELTDTVLARYRNQGGFDLLGSGRTKIETPEQLDLAQEAMWALELHGLVIIGGDDSNTNAAVLAEYFITERCPCQVIGIPKTIDGDLKNEWVEAPFGFDTACKTYSEIIGNIARDALSAKKYTYFIKLMGRSASHIALECALQTHPNIALISEEVAAKKLSLRQLTDSICDVICQRAADHKDYSVILLPEGIIEFIPEFKILISELNKLLTPDLSHRQMLQKSILLNEKLAYLKTLLSPESFSCFAMIPPAIQSQLLMDRDPHGNVQVSKIETERLFIGMVEKELDLRTSLGTYVGRFSPQPEFCGYEGRSCFPSNFDANYCYTLGHVAALLLESGATSYITYVKGLAGPIEEWQVGGIPLTSMIHLEERHGKSKPVIQKALVDLQGPVFAAFNAQRGRWATEDLYRYPGPIQFFGPANLTDTAVFSVGT